MHIVGLTPVPRTFHDRPVGRVLLEEMHRIKSSLSSACGSLVHTEIDVYVGSVGRLACIVRPLGAGGPSGLYRYRLCGVGGTVFIRSGGRDRWLAFY
jgi:hypothetical protein